MTLSPRLLVCQLYRRCRVPLLRCLYAGEGLTLMVTVALLTGFSPYLGYAASLLQTVDEFNTRVYVFPNDFVPLGRNVIAQCAQDLLYVDALDLLTLDNLAVCHIHCKLLLAPVPVQQLPLMPLFVPINPLPCACSGSRTRVLVHMCSARAMTSSLIMLSMLG